jgi:uncharacterized protein
VNPTLLPEGRLELLVLQPTSYCNLNCSYCYLADRQVHRRMSAFTLEHAFRKVLHSRLTNRNLIILWHAGEPLTAGLPFFEQAADLLACHKPESIHVTQSVQTNGTLLSDDWCHFLSREQFEVGVSIDGPQFLHDAHRRNWAGHGSFERVMAGISKLRHHGIEFGILSVLTADSLEYPDEIYDFFKLIGAQSVGFNVEEIEHRHTRSTFTALHEPGLRKQYGNFFRRLLQRVEDDPHPLKIRELEQLLKITLRMRNDQDYVYEPMEVSSFRILTILQNGDVSPFSPELAGAPSERYDNFRIGNIENDSLEKIAATLFASRLEQEAQASRELCRLNCAYFQICGGGYFSNKWSENGSLFTPETQACRLHVQTVTDAYLQHFGA